MEDSTNRALGDALAGCSDSDLLELLKSVLAERTDVLQDLANWAVPDLVHGNAKLLENRHVGTLKSFSDSKGYGFISSPEIADALGKDLFLSYQQMDRYAPGTFGPGSRLSFIILSCKGKLQAYDVLLESQPAAAPLSIGTPRVPQRTPRGPELHADRGWHTDVGTGYSAGKSVGKNAATLNSHGINVQRFEGIVKSFNAGKRFGFLVSKDLIPILGKEDIFVHSSQLGHIGDLSIGELMSFRLDNDDKGQPMAVELDFGGQRGGKGKQSDYGPIPWITGQRYEAPVKSYNAEKKYGFLFCEALSSTFGKADIFIHASEIDRAQLGPNDMKVGQVMSFTVVGDDAGKPMAVDLALGGIGYSALGKGGKGKAVPRAPGTYRPIPELEGQRFEAPVKSFNAEKQYGFLLCEELSSTFGKPDIFIHKTQLGELDKLHVGQVVSFSVVADDDGKPMAVELSTDDEPRRKRARGSILE